MTYAKIGGYNIGSRTGVLNRTKRNSEGTATAESAAVNLRIADLNPGENYTFYIQSENKQKKKVSYVLFRYFESIIHIFFFPLSNVTLRMLLVWFKITKFNHQHIDYCP